MCSSWLGKVSSAGSISSTCWGAGGRTRQVGGAVSSARNRSFLAHLGNVVHEVHAGLVGFGVGQLEQRGHAEADGVSGVAPLNHTM